MGREHDLLINQDCEPSKQDKTIRYAISKRFKD